MSVYQKIRHGVAQGFFQYDFEIGGCRAVGSTKCYDRASAERFEQVQRRKFEKLVEQRKSTEAAALEQTARQTLSPIYTMREAGQSYIEYIKCIGQKKWKEFSRQVDVLVEFFGPDTLILTIDNGQVQKLLAHARKLKRRNENKSEKNLCNSTIYGSFIARLKVMLQYARDMRKSVLPHMPDWSGFVLKKDNPRTRYLSFAESERLDAVLLATFPEYYPIDKFARISGLRLANLVNLKWSEIDWDKKEINVTIKGDFNHTVPISREIEELLKQQLYKHGEYVFTVTAKITTKGRADGRQRIEGKLYPVGREMYKMVSRRAFNLAGIEGYCIHCHRHTTATWLYAARPDILAVQMLLGHRDPSVTRRYTKLDLSAVRAAMDAATAECIRARMDMLAGRAMQGPIPRTLNT